MDDGLSLLHEDNCTYVVYEYIILHKVCINGESHEAYNVTDLVGDVTQITVATSGAKKRERPTTSTHYEVECS